MDFKETIFFRLSGLATEGFQNENRLFTLKIFVSDNCNANIDKTQGFFVLYII